MDWDLILWLIVFLSNIVLLTLLIYQIICLSDLEADYMNPYESSSNINGVVLPEFLLQGALCVLFLLSGRWIMFLMSSPLAFYHLRLFLKREHLVDVTEIFQALKWEKKLRLKKLAAYLFFFMLAIVRLVIALYNSLVDEDEAVQFWLF
ncbi:hypothetical protein Dimus_029673 [Dionaea muscipula]